ncbi:MAG: 4-deoxy-4-formamido-L-arabinose-phosphoundecaprenol deformylase [Desulfobulbaceae bacterium]|jgi:undecaprenyl phosphate-alpha-L-ara4FN deformylase|nr:4-deoxy-4-formamido-L-arabinose-phosphoundecaprenol deformylase [Desulfobulbaceae bacterium]
MSRVGLRVDVDTLRGTRIGVPNLLALFARHHIQATFFFSVGPDNMGRHLWRLARPQFFLKMLRTRAASLYGWDILLRGTLWPGPEIGKHCAPVMRATAKDGHETGLHAWDHHRWQSRLTCLNQQALLAEIGKGYDALAQILGKPPDCFAAPAWRVTPDALAVLDRFAFRFQSDCRGSAPFQPVVPGRRFQHVQVPTTLPTYDELIGATCTPQEYNEHLLARIKPDHCNVLTIHAEVEGVGCLDMFADFLEKAERRGITFEPLGQTLNRATTIPEAGIGQKTLPGRDGWLAWQETGDGS